MKKNSVLLNAPTNNGAAQKIKLTGKQNKEMATHFWRWVEHENEPAIAILPLGDEMNPDPERNCPRILESKSIGRISTVGETLAAEIFIDDGSLTYWLFDFGTPAQAQAFAKRMKRKKHQTLILGDQCIRICVLMKAVRDTNAPCLEPANRDDDSNLVLSIGKPLTKGRLLYLETLPLEDHDQLVDQLEADHRSDKPLIEDAIPEMKETVTTTELILRNIGIVNAEEVLPG